MAVKGLSSLNRLIDRLKTLDDVVYLKIVEIIEREKPALEEFARQTIEAGKKPDGEPLTERGYSPGYAAYKQKYGRYKQVGHVDFKLTGKFLNALKLEYQGNLIWEFSDTDSKKDQLFKKYSLDDSIFDLNESDLQDFADEIVLPELIEFLDDYLTI